MSDVISLSSSDEESPPPKKKMRPNFMKPNVLRCLLNGVTITPVIKHNIKKLEKQKCNNNTTKVSESVVVLSDDEESPVCEKKEDKSQNSETKVVKLQENTGCIEIMDDDCEIIPAKSPEVEDRSKTGKGGKDIVESSTGKENISGNILKNGNENSPLCEEKEDKSKNSETKVMKLQENTSCIEIMDDDCEIIPAKSPEVKEDRSKTGKGGKDIVESPTGKENISGNILKKCNENSTETDLNRNISGNILKNVNENSRESDLEILSDDQTECLEISSDDQDESDIVTDEHNYSNRSNNSSSSPENKQHSDSSEDSKSSKTEEAKSEQTTLLETFLNVCEETMKDSQYEGKLNTKFPVLWKYYKTSELRLGKRHHFKDFVIEQTNKAKQSAAKSVITFKEVFEYVKDFANAESVEIADDDTRRKLKKLEKTVKLLTRKIKELEEAEVDFEAEEDSSYMQYDRFTNRLHKVYAKYCELLKRNPYSGRITHVKLDFVDSDYNEINRAISRKYKNNQKFPSYLELEKLIKKVAEDHDLHLGEAQLKAESIRCFRKLGELLQSRRKRELYDTQYSFIKDREDPATNDSGLLSTLKENYAQGQEKIEKLCQEFVIKEELGEEAFLSQESEKSEYVDSEEELDSKGKGESESEGKKSDSKGKEESDSEDKESVSKGKESDSKGKESDNKSKKESDSKGKRIDSKAEEESDSEGKETDNKGKKESDSEGKGIDSKAEEESDSEGKESDSKSRESDGKDKKEIENSS